MKNFDLEKGYFPDAEEVSEKAASILEAVIRLYAKGMPFYQMKVSEIAKEAGIGKGTVYEYFSNKEEILVRAVKRKLNRDIEGIFQSIIQKNNFDEIIFTALDWIEENAESNFAFGSLLMKTAYDSGPQEAEFLGVPKGFLKCLLDAKQYTYTIDKILEAGVREGLIREAKNNMERRLAFSLFPFFMQYLITRDENEEVSVQDVKQFIRDMIVKIFS